MRLHHGVIELATAGNPDVRDITDALRMEIRRAGIRQGLATVFLPGSTGAITTIEFEPGAVEDLKAALERLAPRDIDYAHDRAWGDGNGYAHVRSALLKTSFTLPVDEGRPLLGSWQQVVFLDFDNRPRSRRLVVQVLGE